jgi:murein DD-endopeptidase MepM/ murein hydrolase activator NlpD
MSHSSSAAHPRAAAARSHTAASVSRSLNRPQRGGDYTLVHAGRQVRIGPVAFWIVVGTAVVMGIWTIGTGTYFAFRDSVLAHLMGRQAQMQYAYEDRIAELRAQVDRIMSRQLLDQEQFEQKLNALIKRQAVLESRTSALGGEGLTTGAIRGTRAPAEPVRPKASPISDTVIFVAPPDREARLESRNVVAAANHPLQLAKSGGLEGVLARVASAMDRVEKRQSMVLAQMEEHADGKARRMRSVLDDLGVNVGKTHPRGVGGPFVPLKPPGAAAGDFERQLYRVNLARAEADRYSQALVTVPVRKPVAGEIDLSSGFGVRMDPFLHRPAMHTGLDMRGDSGDPVHATAAGRVTIAGREGGYGNMVEINHGNGFATRYGHLSEIDVKVGQTIHIGQVIGKVGSTGRSTGPHLHYETRIDGEAVDPQKFLRAGVRLGGLI